MCLLFSGMFVAGRSDEREGRGPLTDVGADGGTTGGGGCVTAVASGGRNAVGACGTSPRAGLMYIFFPLRLIELMIESNEREKKKERPRKTSNEKRLRHAPTSPALQKKSYTHFKLTID